jgi:hypothetical protein
LLVFLFIAATEVIAGRFPELFAAEPLALEEAPWPPSQTLHYELRHPGDEVVGSATCALGRDGDRATAACELTNEAYEVQVARSFWAAGAGERSFEASYNAAGMTLVALTDQHTFDGGALRVEVAPEGESLQMRVAGAPVGESTSTVPPTALIAGLWPWQLSALPFSAGGTYSVTLVYPQRWDETLERSVLTITGEAVVVGGAEPVSVPAGDFLAWKVRLGDDTAWYAVEPPHTLLQYDGGMLLWRLQAAR